MSQTPNEQFTLSEMQKALSIHIWKNGHLREEIIKNPKATIERDLNVKFDDQVKINIVNHTDPNQVTFVLPYDIHKAVGKQLDDAELEQIAGGWSIKSFVKKINFGSAGEIIGDALGSGVQFGGRLVGLNLPDTGLGKKAGGFLGSKIESKIRN